MDELKLLIETVAGLPTLTLWVLGGYLIYKLAILGSLYGTIRYLAQKFVEWQTTPPPPPPPKEFNLNGVAINENVATLLISQIIRIARTGYIHASDVKDLSIAIDTMMEARK